MNILEATEFMSIPFRKLIRKSWLNNLYEVTYFESLNNGCCYHIWYTVFHNSIETGSYGGSWASFSKDSLITLELKNAEDWIGLTDDDLQEWKQRVKQYRLTLPQPTGAYCP